MISQEFEDELRRVVYRESYYEFFKWAFRVLFPNEKYEDAPHVKYLCDVYQGEIERIIRKQRKQTDYIINIPPRTSKTLISHTIFLPWVWTVLPSFTMIAASFDEELILLNAQYSKDIITSEEYKRLFPEVKIRSDFNSKSFFMNTEGGFKMSKTTGGNITGHKGLWICTDDIQNPKTAESEVFRQTAIDYFTRSLYNRLTPVQYGVRVNIQQRLHENDLSGYLLKKHPQEFRHICLPAEKSKFISPPELVDFYVDGLLDPIRLDKISLRSFKTILGTRGYVGQYSQRPAPEEGGIIKEEWFDIVDPSTLTRDPINEPIHFFIDSAYTDKTENDPTAILAGFKRDNFLYVLDVVEVWKTFPDLLKFIPQYTSRFQYNSQSKIFIEPKASGISIAQQLRTTTMLNVIEAPSPKDSKVTRVHGITPLLESRRVKLVAGPYIEHFIEQLKTFPNATHDDMTDVLVIGTNELLVQNNPDYLFL